MRPIQRPVAFSITENIEKPSITQPPAMVQIERQTRAGGSTPPRWRCTSASAPKASQGS